MDLDFGRYIRERRGAIEMQAREGAAYAYPADLKILRTLGQVRPVRTALELTARVFGAAASPKAPIVDEPLRQRLDTTLAKAAHALHLKAPRLRLSPGNTADLCALGGTEQDPVLEVSTRAAALSELELLHVVGAACGGVQNQHVAYASLLESLERRASELNSWIVAPARAALRLWNRRAEVTRDRAGLLCTRSLDTSLVAIDQTTSDTAERKRRRDALTIFASSRLYRGTIGEPDGVSIEECNARTAEAISS